MPQSGFTPVQTYSSSTPGNVPLAANLINSTQGAEMAINIADGKLFYKNSSGVVTIIATNGTAVIGGSTTQVQYNSGGVLAGSANMTFNGTSLTLANDATIHGLTVGLGGGSVSSNTAVGSNTLGTNSTGAYNSFFGNSAGYGVTGSYNTGVGYQVFNTSTSASQNTAIGYQAAYSNTSGNLTAIGWKTLYSNTTGTGNIGIGASASAMFANTTGSNNIAIGDQALNSNTTASNNTAVGYQAGYSTTTSGNNTFIGNQAGYYNTTGSYNVYVGNAAGFNGTGVQNTCIGQGAGYFITSGSYNTILGEYNGNQGGLDIRTASNYIVLSDGNGNPRGIFDGSGNLLVGTSVNSNARGTFVGGTISNTTSVLYASDSGAFGAIGRSAISQLYNANSNTYDVLNLVAGTSSYTGTMDYRYTNTNSTTAFNFCNFLSGGNGTVFKILGNGNVQNANNSYGAISDIKLKENIVDATPKLADLMNVKVRNYNLISDPRKTKQIGVVAQEIQTVFPSVVESISDKDAEGKDLGTTTLSVKYSVLVPILVKAIQELNATVTAQAAQIAALQAKVGA